jgi:hypothetical protein
MKKLAMIFKATMTIFPVGTYRRLSFYNHVMHKATLVFLTAATILKVITTRTFRHSFFSIMELNQPEKIEKPFCFFH